MKYAVEVKLVDGTKTILSISAENESDIEGIVMAGYKTVRGIVSITTKEEYVKSKIKGLVEESAFEKARTKNKWQRTKLLG